MLLPCLPSVYPRLPCGSKFLPFEHERLARLGDPRDPDDSELGSQAIGSFVGLGEVASVPVRDEVLSLLSDGERIGIGVYLVIDAEVAGDPHRRPPAMCFTEGAGKLVAGRRAVRRIEPPAHRTSLLKGLQGLEVGHVRINIGFEAGDLLVRVFDPVLFAVLYDLLIDTALLLFFVLIEDIVGCPRDTFLGVVTWAGRHGRECGRSRILEPSIGQDTCPYRLGTSRRSIAVHLPP